MNIRQCDTCKWFVMTQTERRIGECHFEPPRAFAVPVQVPGQGIQPNVISAFPTIPFNAFCAKWDADVNIKMTS